MFEKIPDWLIIREGSKVKYFINGSSGDFLIAEVIHGPRWGWDMFDGRAWVFSLKFENGTIIHSIALWQIEEIK